MGLASHLGPWLLGSIKNSTGGDPSNSRNMGATVVAQNQWLLPGALLEGPNFVYGLMFIPAGSQIIDYQVDVAVPVGGLGVTAAELSLASFSLLQPISSFLTSIDLTTTGRSNSVVNVISGMGPGTGVPTVGTYFNTYINSPQFPDTGFDAALPNGGAVPGPGTGINYPPPNQQNIDVSAFISVTGAPLDPIGQGIINVTVMYQVRNPDGSYNPEYGPYYPNGPAYYTGP